ncbi:hypothetical protein AB8U03_00135 [Clostridium sp. Mt-5]|uniref:Uncharacterized protein n=1 Tax=Clostridium moutaii TaxID=3240932 RepID=A0ABV4BIK8_9CLOT
MIKWVFYAAGIIFLALFIISMVKPIFFKEKWRAGLGYGLYAALYLGLFFLMFLGEYNIPVKNTNTNVKTSQVSVNGPITALEPRSINQSVFQDIPIQEVKKVPVQEVAAVPIENVTATNTVSADNNNQYVDANGKGTIIGDTDSKIYHLPGDPYYNTEMQKLSNNEYFKTPTEAEAAGYRAIK